jgi:hypothetical protein
VLKNFGKGVLGGYSYRLEEGSQEDPVEPIFREPFDILHRKDLRLNN